MIERQEGYYWVKRNNKPHEIAFYKVNQKLDGISTTWYLIDDEMCYYDEDFEHINEIRIKQPGELPD